MDNSQKVQFEFSNKVMERIEVMQKQLGMNSKAALIRHSLSLLDWVLNEVQPSDIITIEDVQGNLLSRMKGSTLQRISK